MKSLGEILRERGPVAEVEEVPRRRPVRIVNNRNAIQKPGAVAFILALAFLLLIGGSLLLVKEASAGSGKEKIEDGR